MCLTCCLLFAVARTTFELQQAQLADPIGALRYEHQLATYAVAPSHHEPSPVPQLDPASSMLHANAKELAERQAHGEEDTDAPGTSVAHTRPASLGWARLKKLKLAARADGSQDVGSKRRRDADTGGYAIGMCTLLGALWKERCVLVIATNKQQFVSNIVKSANK